MDEAFWNDGYMQWVSIRGTGISLLKEHLFSHLYVIHIHSFLSGHHWGNWLQKMDHIYTREHFQPQNKGMSCFRRAWMSLEDIVPGTDSKHTLCHSHRKSHMVQLLTPL